MSLCVGDMTWYPEVNIDDSNDAKPQKNNGQEIPILVRSSPVNYFFETAPTLVTLG